MLHGVGANDVNVDRTAAYRQEQTIGQTVHVSAKDGALEFGRNR